MNKPALTTASYYLHTYARFTGMGDFAAEK